MLDNLKKLDVGDIAAYETWKREKKRKELILSFRELYGDNLPSDAVMQIDRELGAIKGIFASGDVEINIEAVQYLLWRSVRKDSPDMTIEQVGEQMTTDNMGKYIEQIMPSTSKVGEGEKKPEVTP